MDEPQFIAEAMGTMKARAEMTLEALGQKNDRVFISVFTAPDRIGHTFYRYLDPKSPAPKSGDVTANAAALDASYDEMDRIVGKVVAALGAGDILLIMSDHGFGSFRRGFHMNRWLAQEGYLVLKAGVKEPRDFFLDVDWSKTRAYGMGTGSIYVNIKGRERDGSVDPGEARKVATEIAKKILAVKDGKTQVVVGAFLGDEIYQGPQRRDAPDVRVALADGYRASWATTLGGIPTTLFEDNDKKWSGDHASADPEAVPGILVSNVPIQSAAPRIEDLSATAYAFTGVTPPPGVVGTSLIAGPGGAK
jgi:predicted AlkP superfamily phosphohydrolase/phosphomutase